MIRSRYTRIWMMIVSGALLLAGCGTDPVQPDQEVQLQPGYGIAAVVFDTLDTLTAIDIESPDRKGGAVSIAYVEKGVHTFVYTLPAGRYCLTHFNTSFFRFTQNDPIHGICFDVIPGKVAYSGNLAPRAYGQSTRTDQNYDWRWFEGMFKESM